MIPVKKITIGSVTYHVKLTFRALIEFEQATGHAIGFESTADALMLFYAAVKAGEKAAGIQFNLSYDELLDQIDEYPEALAEIYKVLTEEAKDKKK